MPPWNTMTPQQQQQLLQLMMSRGTGGMQFGGGNPYGAIPGMMPQPGAQMQGAAQLGVNPLTGQAAAPSPMMGQMNPSMAQNPMLMQYLMGLQGQGGGMQQPSLAQLLQMRGAGMGL